MNLNHEALTVRVHEAGRFFEDATGAPFFWLADTAWMLFNKLTEAEARRLFANRADKGFTAVQAVVFRDLFEPNTPNVAGVRPFASDADLHAARLNPAWLDHVVAVTRAASEHGLVMGLLPTWGDKWNEHSNSAGPVIFDRDNARRYGRDLSDALGDCANVVWIMGGDSRLARHDHVRVLRAMAEGIREGASGSRLMTFHPPGSGSSEALHAEPWLDFHAVQTGHGRLNPPNYFTIERLFNLQPPRPCMEMECTYEWMPVGISQQDGVPPERRARFEAYDVRKSYYRSVLAGGAGFTYGCEAIRQVHRSGDRPHAWDGRGLATWDEGLAAPGASQLDPLKRLLLERPFFSRAPAQELLMPYRTAGAWADGLTIGAPMLEGVNVDPASHIRIARCRDGRYLFAYLPIRQSLKLDTSPLASRRLRISVYDPETGETTASWEQANTGELVYLPTRILDTLLVIDAL